MASTSPLSQPAPVRSPGKPNVDLRHPVPDLQSLQGAYVGNIERLEEHAERMSESGSDLQEEIRKTYSELKLTDSRRSSLHSLQTGDELTRRLSTRSRGLSISSHANSIVDLNGNARWGGYSPGGYVTSPAGSLRSGTFAKPSTSIQRQRSESKASRLGQIVHAEEEEDTRKDRSLTSPQSAPVIEERDSSQPPLRKVSSFTRIFDDVANGLPEELRNSIITGTPPRHVQEHHHQDVDDEYPDHRNLPDRPPTAASTDTTHQARTLWQDFDGTHCPDTVQEESESMYGSHRGHSRPSSYSQSFMMDNHSGHHSMGAPPPEDGMVFYPAPVPKMLNLPQRLSNLPPSDTRTRRRTQVLESMQSENRKSMPLGGDPNAGNKRKSQMNLPPQLRASAYFDNRAAPSQEFAVKGESAEVTLESILDASARAPVSAFTDHPFAGDVSKDVYKSEHKRKSSKMPEVPTGLQEVRRRSSFNILDTNHNANGERLKKLKKRNSSADMNLLLVKASENRMSLTDELDHPGEDDRGPHTEQKKPANRRYYQSVHLEHGEVDELKEEPEHDEEREHSEEEHEEEEEESEEEEEEEEEEEGEPEPQYGAPTTLLAELQLRQAKQKGRNMNYVTLMEQGLIDGRKTLLQLNDVAEAEKQRRLRKKVNLAWEAEDDDSEDDVPLGVLYKEAAPQLQHLVRKPMGLIEQRELEDHEPLSKRRNRLRGLPPNHRDPPRPAPPPMQPNPAVPEADGASDEEEGETLADRMRRLREKQQLDSALGDDIRKSAVSGDFAAEMMSKFGGPEGAQDPAKGLALPDAGEEEEETLGQRRARLQAEAAARGENITQRPILHGSSSLADILSANPLDPYNQTRKVSNEALLSTLPQGSLLHKNVVEEERRKQQRLNAATRRASSYGPLDPLVPGIGDKEKDDDDIPLGQKIQAYKENYDPRLMKPKPTSASVHRLSLVGSPSQPQQQEAPPQPQPLSQPRPRPRPQPQPHPPSMLGMSNNMGMMSTPSFNSMAMPQPTPQPQPMMGMNMGMPMGMGMNPMMRPNTIVGMPGMGMPGQQPNPMGIGMGGGMPGMGVMPGMGMGMGGMNNGMNMGMGGGMNMGMGMPGMPGMPGMGMMPNGMGMMGPPMDPRQRDQIDRWMQGIRN